MKLNLEDKVALVTGAGSGIGRATAIQFAREGSHVVIADWDQAGGYETLKLVESEKASGLYVECDISNESNVEALIQQTLDKYGRLNCAVNNAGLIQPMLPTTDHAEDAWNHIINVNLKGVWLCLKHEIGAMLQSGGGSIVNTCSAASIVGFANLQMYTASKHGVLGLTRASALEYAKAGIRINAVGPGSVDTPMTRNMAKNFGDDPSIQARIDASQPIGRAAQPAEIANAIIWLCSDAASFVVGHLLMVDGGMTIQ